MEQLTRRAHVPPEVISGVEVRRRALIVEALEENGRTISDPEELKRHIEDYYKQLFGLETREPIRLNPDIWLEKGHLLVEDQELLEAPFSMDEIELAIKEMKTNTAPGPDGFPVRFYKALISKVRGPIKEMMDELFEGNMNLSRINYGLITLIPKVKEANI